MLYLPKLTRANIWKLIIKFSQLLHPPRYESKINVFVITHFIKILTKLFKANT